MSFLPLLLHWHILVLWKVARREETSGYNFFMQCNQRMYLQQKGLTIWFKGTPKATIISEKPCFLDSAMCFPLLLFMSFYITVLPFLLMHCGVFYPSINFYMSGCPRWNGTRILQLSGSWHFVNKKRIKAKKSGVVRSSKWDGKNTQCDRQSGNRSTSEDKYRTCEHKLKLSQCKRAHYGILEGGNSKEHHQPLQRQTCSQWEDRAQARICHVFGCQFKNI